MIKIIIIDDDVEILQGLSNIINWEDYGFQIIGTAKNGLDGLKLISEHIPDAILTDITMPLMNGLELIQEAKKLNPAIKSVIISCHEDFQYAREALRLEADEYILKHTLTKDDLIKVISSLRDKIETERNQKIHLTEAIHKLNMNKHVILEKFFLDIMNNHIIYNEKTYYQTSLMGITIPKGSFQVIGLFIDNIDEILFQQPITEYNLLKFCILNIIEETLGENNAIHFFFYKKDVIALLYWNQSIINLVKQIQSNVQLFLKFKLSACSSHIYYDISQLKTALKETESYRKEYFYSGSGNIITTAKTITKHSSNLYKKFGPQFKSILSVQNPIQITEFVDELFITLQVQCYEPDCVKTLLRRLMVDMEIMLDKYMVNVEILPVEGDTFSQCKKMFYEAMQDVFKKLRESGNTSSRTEIHKVIEYIETHLNEEISCEKMANYVNMNSNYFSRLFKSEMNMSFSDYIKRKRMNVATELLSNSDYSIEEIANAIGIESTSYFYRAYKKTTGHTPGDIRNK